MFKIEDFILHGGKRDFLEHIFLLYRKLKSTNSVFSMLPDVTKQTILFNDNKEYYSFLHDFSSQVNSRVASTNKSAPQTARKEQTSPGSQL